MNVTWQIVEPKTSIAGTADVFGREEDREQTLQGFNVTPIPEEDASLSIDEFIKGASPTAGTPFLCPLSLKKGLRVNQLLQYKFNRLNTKQKTHILSLNNRLKELDVEWCEACLLIRSQSISPSASISFATR